MSFTLTMSGVIVGRTDLENRDAVQRVARGIFRPGLGYELAQPVFDLYEAARMDPAGIDRYRRARDALQLRLTDAGGTPVTFRELHIQRANEAAGEGDDYMIEVSSDDPRLWSTSPTS